MVVDNEQLQQWLTVSTETEHLEFKEAKNSFEFEKLVEYCVALANEGGGHIVLGITDTPPRKVVGTSAFNQPARTVGGIYERLHIKVTYKEIQHKDGRVLVFKVPARPIGSPLEYKGKYLMRAGEDLVPMTPDKLKEIFEEGKPDFLQLDALSDASESDVIKLLDTQSYFDLMDLPYPENRKGVLDRFEREKFIARSGHGYRIKNLGAILFAKRLDDFSGLVRKSPRVVIYDGTGKLKVKIDQIERVGYAVGFKNLVDFVISQIPTNEVIEKAIRKTVKMFPEIAIRELVANALIHQDFAQTGTSVMIEVYTDRIEISNPGHPIIRPERFIDEYQSRNEKLADVMRRVGVCEELGSGVDKVIESAEIFQLPAPDFRISDRRTTCILFSYRNFNKMSPEDRIRACYQHCCLRYVMNEKMTNKSLRERFNLGEKKTDAVSRVIRDTVAKGIIKPEDAATTSRRYAKYVPFWA